MNVFDFLRLLIPKKKHKRVSMLDIDVRRRELGLTPPTVTVELTAMMCLSEEHNRIIIAPTYSRLGVFISREPVTVVPFQSKAAEVGRLARNALLAFEVRNSEPLPQGKPRDNPFFQASGLKTLRKFNTDYKFLSLRTAGGSVRVEESVEYSEDPLDYVRVFGDLAPACSHEDLGRVILEVYLRGQYLKSRPKR